MNEALRPSVNEAPHPPVNEAPDGSGAGRASGSEMYASEAAGTRGGGTRGGGTRFVPQRSASLTRRNEPFVQRRWVARSGWCGGGWCSGWCLVAMWDDGIGHLLHRGLATSARLQSRKRCSSVRVAAVHATDQGERRTDQESESEAHAGTQRGRVIRASFTALEGQPRARLWRLEIRSQRFAQSSWGQAFTTAGCRRAKA